MFFVASIVGIILCLGVSARLFARHGVGAAGRFLVLRVDAVDAEDFFVRRASFATSVQIELPLGPQQVWETLWEEGFFSWLPGVRGYRYRPVVEGRPWQRTFVSYFWVGEEQLVLVQPSKVLMSSLIAASTPGWRHVIHRYELSETATGGTVLEWTLGVSPVACSCISLRWLAPVIRPGMRLILSGIRLEM